MDDHLRSVQNGSINNDVARKDSVLPRLVDTEHTPRTKDMKVLVVAIFEALEKLGYTPYNMSTAQQHQPSRHDLTLWTSLLRAKSRFTNNKNTSTAGTPIIRADFDKFLADYDALTDLPASFLAEELVAAYPGTKVILTTRDGKGWAKSVRNTIWAWYRSPSYRFLAYFDGKLIGPLQEVLGLFFEVFRSGDAGKPMVEAYETHNDLVRRVCEGLPEGRFVEYRVSAGWGPLCEFLRKEVPTTPFPKTNGAKDFHIRKRMARNAAFRKVMGGSWSEYTGWRLAAGMGIGIVLGGLWVVWEST